MLTETKKRVEIIVERSLLNTLVEVIDDAGATGYTVFPCLAGRGEHGPWQSGDLSPAFDRVYILVITNELVAQALLANLREYLTRYSAVVTVSDSRVIRGDRF